LSHAKPRSREGWWVVGGGCFSRSSPRVPLPVPRRTEYAVRVGARSWFSVSGFRFGGPRTGVRGVVCFCSSGFPARAQCCAFLTVQWQDCRVGGPLTPDPSPPFHGGEGKIAWAVIFCSSGFPARDLPFCGWNAWRSPLRGWGAVLSHARPRSRRSREGKWVVGGGGGGGCFSSTSRFAVRQGGLVNRVKLGVELVFGFRFGEPPGTGVAAGGCFRSSGFPARDLPFCDWNAWRRSLPGGGLQGWCSSCFSECSAVLRPAAFGPWRCG
jgi:hypothetical protein